MQKGNIGVTTENIFPVIKKFLYSENEIFLRELVSNAVDATQKIKTLASMGDFKGELGDLTVEVKLDIVLIAALVLNMIRFDLVAKNLEYRKVTTLVLAQVLRGDMNFAVGEQAKQNVKLAPFALVAPYLHSITDLMHFAIRSTTLIETVLPNCL